MGHPRRGLCGLLLLALLAAGALTGCAGGEDAAPDATAQPGVVGQVVAQLKKEDDEQEVREIHENEASSQELEEFAEAEEQEQTEAQESVIERQEAHEPVEAIQEGAEES